VLGVPVRMVLRAVLLLASLIWVPWVVAWLIDLDRLTWKIPAAEAFLPYVIVATAAVLVAALRIRALTAIVIAAVGLAALVAPRIDWVQHDPQPAARGPVITVATSNVFLGTADTAALTRLVRAHGVDILAIEENTPEWDAAARRAGLRTLLPDGISIPDQHHGAAGLALWSRWPIETVPPAPGDHRSLGGIIRIPGAPPIHIRSVHPSPPFNTANIPCWRHCTRAFAKANTVEPNAILAGDFNATLDHHPLRGVLRSGYRDAAEQTGYAWHPTWTNGSWATLTIDHILVTRRIAVLGVTAHDLAATDHDVVVTRLRLPR
jgi:endonuclease/exonuclease/phosphatase family metal-dependent hydrolase